MNSNIGVFNPSYIRMSGEIADQKIIDSLKEAYPNAKIASRLRLHRGRRGFPVNDEFAGFPVSMIGQSDQSTRVKIVDGTLRIKSPFTAADYVGRTRLVCATAKALWILAISSNDAATATISSAAAAASSMWAASKFIPRRSNRCSTGTTQCICRW